MCKNKYVSHIGPRPRGLGFTEQLNRPQNMFIAQCTHYSYLVFVSFLKKKRIRNPNLQYRKAKEPTVKLNGLAESFNSKVVRP